MFLILLTKFEFNKYDVFLLIKIFFLQNPSPRQKIKMSNIFVKIKIELNRTTAIVFLTLYLHN